MGPLTDEDKEAAGSAMVAIVAIIGFTAVWLASLSFGDEARTFPRLVAVLGGLSGAVCLAVNAPRLLAVGWNGLGQLAGGGDRMNLILSYLGPALYAALLYLLGFWIASAVGLIGLFLLLGERRPVLVVGLTALTLGMIYGIFDLGFDIRMPGSAVFEFPGA